MTSTDERHDTGADPLLAASPIEVEQGICRELLKHGFTADDPVLIDPDLIDAVMTVAGPVLEAKDAEIARLRAAVKTAGSIAEDAVGERLAVLELNARASERVRCAAYLDGIGFTDAAGLLAMRTTGVTVDAGKARQT